MTKILRSRVALILLLSAAAFQGLRDLLATIASATLAGPSDTGTLSAVVTASSWLQCVAGAAVLGAFGFIASRLFPERRWSDLAETTGASVGALLLTIGLLVSAATSTNSAAGFVVSAIGVGIFAMVLIVGGARAALREQGRPDRTAALRLAAGGSAVLVAIALGLPYQTTLSVLANVLDFIGIAVLLAILVIARRRNLMTSRALPLVSLGLAVLSVRFLTGAFVSGLWPNANSLTPWRVSWSIVNFLDMAAFLVLSWAAIVHMGAVPAAESRPTETHDHRQTAGQAA